MQIFGTTSISRRPAMASRDSPEIDDELFDEVYGKAYTGPPTLVTNNLEEKRPAQRAPANDLSDDDDANRDPNAVPTDFTSREARVWEAKAKATERNWKKRKEEEMICKLCGEAGHFTQGCPSTLGANRKYADLFERVPARDARVRSLFSEKVIHQIEKDIGCKIKMDEKFLFVSGKDRLVLSKGVDAVHKVIQAGAKGKGNDSSSSPRRSRSPNDISTYSQTRRSESERSHSSQRDIIHFQNKNARQDRTVEDRIREDPQKISRGSPQAYNYDGPKRRPVHSRSPQKTSLTRQPCGSYDSPVRKSEIHASVIRAIDKHITDVPLGRKYNFSSHQKSLEELEMEFKKDATELGRVRDKEEDEENCRHRECIRDQRDNYMRKLAVMRAMHAKQWENFIQLDIQRRQQTHHNTYDQPGYLGYDRSSGDAEHSGISRQIDSLNRYKQYAGGHYSDSVPLETYGEFQWQRQEDFGNTYNRY